MRTSSVEQRVSRNTALNFLKGVGCIAVVLIHVKFPNGFGVFMTNLAQFAVPIFFMISGYFAYNVNRNVLKRRALKITKITIWATSFFSLCRILFLIKDGELNLWLLQLADWKVWMGLLILNDFDFIKAGHLWFLPALIYAYVVLYIVEKRGWYLFFYKILPCLFSVLLLVGIYISMHGYSYHWGANILSSLPFVLMGHYIASNARFRECWSNHMLIVFSILGILLVCGGQFFEWMTYLWGVGTVVYSISLFLLAVNNPRVRLSEKIESLGDKYSLYIYIFHLAIAGVISLFTKKVGIYENILWGRPILVIALTIAFSMCFYKFVNRNIYEK